MNSKKAIILAGVLLTSFSLTLFSQRGPGGGSPEAAASRQTDPVASARVEERTNYTTVAGRLRPRISVSHPAPAGGIVSQIHVRIGQSVTEGTPLFTFARDESAGSFAPVTVRSRISGIVSSLSVSLHNEIRSGESGAVVINPEQLLLQTYLSDKDTDLIASGLPVRAQGPGGRSLPGTLVSLSPEPDYRTGLFQLHFAFTATEPGWTGRFVTIELPTATVRGVFVSQELLVRRYGQYYLWAVSDENTLRLQRVQTGITVDDDILIISGLPEGSRYLRRLTGREQEGMALPGGQEE
jgi:multidrug efflux pump subunit AcrA (membrane-fusion protein)